MHAGELVSLPQGDEQTRLYMARRPVYGQVEAHDLTGAAITLLVKPDAETPDDDPSVMTSAGAVEVAAEGKYSATWTSEMLTTPGVYPFKITAVTPNETISVMWGRLRVEDT